MGLRAAASKAAPRPARASAAVNATAKVATIAHSASSGRKPDRSMRFPPKGAGWIVVSCGWSGRHFKRCRARPQRQSWRDLALTAYPGGRGFQHRRSHFQPRPAAHSAWIAVLHQIPGRVWSVLSRHPRRRHPAPPPAEPVRVAHRGRAAASAAAAGRRALR